MNIWALIAVAAGAILLFTPKRVLGLNKGIERVAGIAALAFGFWMLFPGAFSGAASIDQTTVASALVTDVTLSGGTANNTPSTTLDYYKDNDDRVVFRVADGQIADDEFVNVTVTVDRAGDVSKAAYYEVACTSTDFAKSGVMYNLVSKDSEDKLEGYVDGSGTRSNSGWKKSLSFTEAEVSDTFTVSFKQDETGEDQITAQDSKVVTCSAGGYPFEIEFVAND